MIEIKLRIYTDPEKTPLSRQKIKEVEVIKWLTSGDADDQHQKTIENWIKQLVRLLNEQFSTLTDEEIDLSKSGFFFGRGDIAMIFDDSYFHKTCKFKFDSEDFIIEITTRNEIKHHFKVI